MLKVIQSPDREDNISYIYDLVHAGVQAGRRQAVIVPETHSHRAEKRLLERCGNGAARLAKVYTFTRLADRILAENGVDAVPIDAGARVLMMYKAVRSVESSLEYYRRAALRPDMLSGLISVASELRSCLVKPEAMMAGLNDFDAKLKDISLIYTAYCAQCAGRPAHGADRIEMALPYIGKYEFLAGADVYVYGFEGFTAAEYGMMEEIIKISAGVTAALTIGDDRQLFSEQLKTKGRLERLASSHNEKLTTEAPPRVGGKSDPVLDMAAKVMFDFSCPTYDNDCEAIKLYTCEDIYQECELVAGMCRRLTLEGVRMRDIAIITSEAEQYESYLSRAFARYGLPMYTSRKEDFLEKPAAMAALGAFRAIEDDMSFPSMLRYMKSDLVGLTRDEQETLENYAYTWQIRGSRWLSEWTMPPDGYDTEAEPEVLDEINRIRAKLVGPLAALKAELPAAGTGKIYIKALKNYLERIDFTDLIEDRAEKLRQAGRRQEAAEYLQIMDILMEAFDQFELTMGEDEMGRSDCLSLLYLMLGQYSIGSIPVSLDAVEFSDFQRAAFGSIEHLFIIGCREGAMPPVVTGGGLLRERDRITLESVGIELTQSDEERTFEYMSDIYQAVNCAVKSLTFTYPQKTFGGVQTRKSYLFDRIEQGFSNIALEDGGPVSARNSLLAHAPSFELLCSEDVPKEEKAAAAAFYSGRDEGQRLRRLRDFSLSKRGPLTNLDNISRLYGAPIHMSATRAEKINSCRFSYFMEYGLRAKERRLAEFKATNVGTLVHFVVENAVRELADGGGDIAKATHKYVDIFLNERLGGKGDKSARMMANYAFLEENIRDIVKDIVDEISSSDFKPLAFEMSFGGGGEYPPLKISRDGVSLDVVGQIDRVDGLAKNGKLYLRVSDYKTGSKDFSLSDVLEGMNLQMFIYILMLRSLTPERFTALTGQALEAAPEPCAALYIPVKSPYVPALPSDSGDKLLDARRRSVRRIGIVTDEVDVINELEHPVDGRYRFLPVSFNKDGAFSASSKVADTHSIELLTAKALDKLDEIAETIAAGELEADPYAFGGGRSYCDWCPYREACQFDVNMARDRYRYLKTFKDSEVLERLKKEEDETNGR